VEYRWEWSQAVAIPGDRRERAIYHIVLADMHRLRGVMLNLEAVEHGETEEALREHFGRELTVLLGKLAEWRLRRSAIFAQAERDFKAQSEPAGEDGGSAWESNPPENA
jgi:hypothetical protein